MWTKRVQELELNAPVFSLISTGSLQEARLRLAACSNPRKIRKWTKVVQALEAEWCTEKLLEARRALAACRNPRKIIKWTRVVNELELQVQS